MGRDPPALPIIGERHNGLGIELDQNTRTHATIWIKTHTLTHFELDHGVQGVVLLDQFKSCDNPTIEREQLIFGHVVDVDVHVCLLMQGARWCTALTPSLCRADDDDVDFFLGNVSNFL